MLSTASELAELGHNLAGAETSFPELTSHRSRVLLTTPSVELPCRYWGRQAQCLGWGFDERNGTSILKHGGGTTGQTAMLLAIPERNITVALLTNSSHGGGLLGEAEEWILSELGLPPPKVAPTASYELTEQEMTQLVGTYSDIWTTTTVAIDNEGLTLTLTRNVHPSAVTDGTELPAVRLSAINRRLVTNGTGRPILFVGADPTDASSPIGYLHQLNASRKISA